MMEEPLDCPHPLEACRDGRCHMCGWVYDERPGHGPQRQDSLTAQMRDVEQAAIRMGCYDAVDWIRKRWGA